MKILLDLQYSDTWTDTEYQRKPVIKYVTSKGKKCVIAETSFPWTLLLIKT